MATLAFHRNGQPLYLRRFLDSHAAALWKERIECPLVMSSDSIETLARLAGSSTLVAALPLRAGKRYGLARLPPVKNADQGTHQIALATRPSVSGDLRRLLRRELTRVLKEVH
jgi:hypothetical protein